MRDKYGDSGLTGVFIARRENKKGIVDSLLLSCRILGKKIEIAFVLEAFAILERKWNINNWIAEYIPTNKNQQVAKFWEHVGFVKLAKNVGNDYFELPAGKANHQPINFITIEKEVK